MRRFVTRNRRALSVLAVAASVGGITAVKLLAGSSLGRETPFLLFALPVMFGAWYIGYRAGLAATGLGALTALFLFADDRPWSHQAVQTMGFLAEGIVITLMGASQRKTHDDLREANAYQDDFLALVSHEMRTPLTTLYAGSRVLHTRLAESGDPADQQLAADLSGESDRLYRMTENLLALARSRVAQPMPEEPISIRRTVKRVLDWAARAAPGRRFKVQIESDLPAAAADPTYTEQVLRNLASNALKYAPPEEPIMIRATRFGKGQVLVTVADCGPGVAREELPIIFDSFYRSHRLARHADGMGLGLTVCKRLVEVQGGRIWANSRSGGGLEVNFTLRAIPDDDA